MFGGMNTHRNDRKEYRSWGKGYYHLSSDGWQGGKLFHTDEQFAYGMTLIGLLTLRFQLIIYDFALMDNHIHLLLSGLGDDCVKAFGYFRRKLSIRLVKDGYPPLPERYGFKLTPIESEEQMRIEFLYIDRNALEKDICLPGGYPWGAGYLHCSRMGEYLRGIKAGTLSKHKQELLTGCRTLIPPHWEIHPRLGLLPVSFVSNALFKRLFPHAKDYQTRLIKEYEAFVRVSRRVGEAIEFSQMEANDIADRMAGGMFSGKRIRDLSKEEKGLLCLPLESQYGLTALQIANALRMPEFLVRQFLTSKDYGKKHWDRF